MSFDWWTTLLPGCLTKLAEISSGQVRTGVDNSGVSLGWRTFDGHMADTCFTFGPNSVLPHCVHTYMLTQSITPTHPVT